MNKNVHSSFVGGQVSCVAQAVRALVAAAALCTPALGLAHAAFADPEQAAKALIQAIERDDAKAMARVLGKDWRRLLPPDGVDPEDKRAFLDMAREAQAVKKTDGRAEVVIGKDEWPLPIPIVQGKDGKWRFDIAGGREAMLDRRIGYNERSAMQAALAYVDAQREYALADRNGDGLLEYAQKFRSSPGKRDGLIWSPSLGDESPIGEDFVPRRKGRRLPRLPLQDPHGAGAQGLARWRAQLPDRQAHDERIRLAGLASQVRRDRRHELHGQPEGAALRARPRPWYGEGGHGDQAVQSR